jgi:hypothetical protein
MLGGLTREAFQRRVYRCDDSERLTAAIEHEIERHGATRKERIGLLNERKQKLRD